MYLVLSLLICFGATMYEFLHGDELLIKISYGIVIPLLILIPRFVLIRNTQFKNLVGINWLRDVEFILVFILLFNTPASLFWHDMDFQYDRFLHFMIGFLLVPLLALLLRSILEFFGDKISKRKLPWLTFVLLLVALFIWEWYQFSLDNMFGTKTFSDSTQLIVVDFWEDILFGFLGAVLGLATFCETSKFKLKFKQDKK